MASLLLLLWLVVVAVVVGIESSHVAAQSACGLTLHEGVALGSGHFYEQDNSTFFPPPGNLNG
eukprot:COSAG02_NODE_26689_length_627_cov_0.837121_2_plen_63_part_00